MWYFFLDIQFALSYTDRKVILHLVHKSDAKPTLDMVGSGGFPSSYDTPEAVLEGGRNNGFGA
jgi:hypothetical protein